MMGKNKKTKKDKATAAADRKSTRQAFGRANGAQEAKSMSQGMRDDLSRALQNNRKEVLAETGLPFNTLARISTGAQPAQAHEMTAINTAAQIIGWTTPNKG